MGLYYRFMSSNELRLVCSGCTIDGKRFLNCKTSSEGVCFLGESTLIHENINYDPAECLEFLSGIVTTISGKHRKSDGSIDKVYLLVEFSCDTELTKTFGIYADPINTGFYDRICIDEYCIHSYSRDILKPLRYGLIDLWDRPYNKTIEWYPLNLV